MMGAIFASAVAVLILLFWMSADVRAERARCRSEQQLREEFEAYARLDLTLRPGDNPRPLARRVCAAVASHSGLHAALLFRDAESRLQVTGSAGLDDLHLAALDAWGARFARDHRSSPDAPLRKSYAVTLGPLDRFDPLQRSTRLGVCQTTILPLWSSAGVMLGALAVCTPSGDRLPLHEHPSAPLETLAAALARAAENVMLSDRLLRAEKMAGLAQLAKGLAHELNNPLTAVLGYAEMIAEATSDPATRQDAAAIIGQADRMRATVDSLLQFWRPAAVPDRSVNLAALLADLAERCRPELARRDIELAFDFDAEAAETPVRGNEDHLLHLFEHLLTNATQAIESFPAPVLPRCVRITLAREGKTLQAVLSDTGGGFTEPARVFDPFYTTRPPGEGPGMGLALSYSIVRAHGGDISAFNLSPHGAAVVVELPVNRAVRESGEHALVA